MYKSYRGGADAQFHSAYDLLGENTVNLISSHDDGSTTQLLG